MIPTGCTPAADGLVVYGTGWCPDVRRSRGVLDRVGVPYRYVDLERDAEATKLVRRLQHGRRRIPTLVWPDGDYLVEPADDQLRARLAAPNWCQAVVRRGHRQNRGARRRATSSLLAPTCRLRRLRRPSQHRRRYRLRGGGSSAPYCCWAACGAARFRSSGSPPPV